MRRRAIKISSFGLFFLIGGAVLPALAETAAPDSDSVRETSPTVLEQQKKQREAEAELQQKIESKNQEIRRLEDEAKRYRSALEEKGKEVQTLQQRISGLSTSIGRLDSNLRLTNAKITRTNFEIEELALEIKDKESSIARNRNRLLYLIGILSERDRETALEILMKNQTISEFFVAVDNLAGLEKGIGSLLETLKSDRIELTGKKDDAENKKMQLSGLRDDLNDTKTLQEYERRERKALLADTKNQERQYQMLLAETERKRDALQQEINSLESGLKATFDSSLLPAAGHGILGWPVPDPIFITQYFGNTAFARSGAYNGQGHNGVDLRAAVGIPIFAAESGIVRATGDTDAACRRASYGRWVLLDHSNNLSTLYAHLSLIKIQSGQAVNRGDLIGYAGKTGYALGPHLHFTVYARQAVNVGQLKSRVCGRVMTLPLSPFTGYLNPLLYL